MQAETNISKIVRPALYIMVILIVFPGMSRARGKVHDFSLKGLDNRQVYFSDLKGEKLTVIDFWATWCQPCIRSIPALVEMSDDFAGQGVNFIGISVDSPRNMAKVKPFTRSMGIRYPILLDPSGETMGDLNVTAVPTLLIVGDDDRILYMHEGFSMGDEGEIRMELEKHLSGSSE